MKIKILIVMAFCLCKITCTLSQSSVLASGSWYKFSVTTDGAYKINYDLLKKAGVNPDKINPKNIRLFSFPTGILPQANRTPRASDLVELAISINGESDGKFDKQDYILFFGQGPDRYSYNTSKRFFDYENNIYSDKNYYFLEVSASTGKRMIVIPALDGSYPIINSFNDFAYYETDKYNILNSGRQWFGEQFDNIKEASVNFNLQGIIPNSQITFTSHVMAQSISDCSFNVLFNNNSVITQSIAAISNTQYSVKGNVTIDTISLSASNIGASSKNIQEIKYQFTKGATPGLSIGYLDFFLFSMERSLGLYNDQTIFTSSESISNTNSTFQVTGTTPNTLVYDVTDPFNSFIQSNFASGNQISFSTGTSQLKKFIAFNSDKASAPSFESSVPNQDIHSLLAPQLLIISYPDFKSEALRLATHRLSHPGVSTLVVTTDEIFNEYSGGRQDLSAIRDFIRDIYKKQSSTLKNVLLFGRGSYDYKNRVLSNTNFVPIYESFNSLSPLETYSSDDYFGFLDDNEGAWPENPAVNYSMDVGVGRLPIKTVDEAHLVVNKLIEYDLSDQKWGVWRKDFLFVADDGDYNIHESQADQLANFVETNHSEFDTKKLYLDSYKQVERASGQFSPDAAKALDLLVRKGVSIVNYTGHGSEQVWMQEQILTPDIILSWKNGPRYPLFVTATCEFGRNDDPYIISSAERIILQKQGGGIGLVTTARPVNSSTNFSLNQAFYNALFIKDNGNFRDLGGIFKDTKNNSVSGISNRNFSLLGDPSIILAFASNNIATTSIRTTTGSDTLKALSQVSVRGEVQNNGSKISGFSGTAILTVFDKLVNTKTLGDLDETVTPPAPSFNFTERSNILFQGEATVNQGAFEAEFTIPTEIAANIGPGKLSLYANSKDQDAIGSSGNFSVGGVEPNPPTDNSPPTIQLFLGDTTFINGGLVGSNTKLIAHLSDNSGINTTSLNPSNRITATLDDKTSFYVNEYYISDKDNSKKGALIYPLDTLSKGSHTLSLTASDVYNNISTSKVDFIVTDSKTIILESFDNYPNPFIEETNFQFTHNRPGEDLDVTLLICDITGQLIDEIEYDIEESTYLVSLPVWSASKDRKLSSGLYLAKLLVRSLTDGSKNERIAKFIVLN